MRIFYIDQVVDTEPVGCLGSQTSDKIAALRSPTRSSPGPSKVLKRMPSSTSSNGDPGTTASGPSLNQCPSWPPRPPPSPARGGLPPRVPSRSAAGASPQAVPAQPHLSDVAEGFELDPAPARSPLRLQSERRGQRQGDQSNVAAVLSQETAALALCSGGGFNVLGSEGRAAKRSLFSPDAQEEHVNGQQGMRSSRTGYLPR